MKIFFGKFVDMFLIFAQSIDCGYTLTSTHNVCFGSKIRKLGIPLYIPVLLCKKGVYFHGHVFLMMTFPDYVGSDVHVSSLSNWTSLIKHRVI